MIFNEYAGDLILLNELELNGENVDDDETTDYTTADADDEDEDTGEEPETTEDEPEPTDYTNEVPEDDEPETEDTPEEPETDETEEEPVDNVNDYTEDIPAEDEDEAEPEDGGAAEPTDYTAEMPDGGEDTEETSEGEDGEEGEPAGDDEAPEDDGADNTSTPDDNLKNMEKELFADLTPQQMAIKNTELLNNYVDLYETLNTIFDSVNKIPKTFENTRAITFVADKLVELRDMVNYTITTTYITRTYVENKITYEQSLVILNQLSTMLKTIAKKMPK